MNIREIKKRMIAYTDFHGQDIPDTEAIKKAKNKQELKNVLDDYRRLLENQHIDSLTYHDKFIKELGLRA